MKPESKEIEMQTYSFCYADAVNNPTILPYHWDGECHLTVNHLLYTSENAIEHYNSHEYLPEEDKSISSQIELDFENELSLMNCLLYTSPSPRDQRGSRMPSSA
eukprot:TRINITY_DN14698_c0_g1_i1.p1 TRINITY_DN14698_c0_g1~~TRINITY_DN14698_c0_g1_i1.p1  ORF type:complete len:104 (-),score=28.82 TRINITY_DN14698_c0_g1_i1:10-321(-)